MVNIVQVFESQPGLTYTLIGVAGGSDPVTGDIYRGLDLFGRVKDLIWTSTGGSSSSSSSSSSGAATIVERVQHGYDQAGNRLWRAEPVDVNDQHDELYDYDGLYRLKDSQRGGLNGTRTALLYEDFAQCWSLDETGNWAGFRQDSTGGGNWDLAQGRTSNLVNEIAAIATFAGSPWVNPEYDKAGNMTTMPQPGSPTARYAAVYDAWNRLAQLTEAGILLARYRYDASTRRIIKQTFSAGILNCTRDYYYSKEWQVLEERQNSSSSPDRQFVWGMRYIDDLVLRDRDATGTGSMIERLFSLQDPNWNLTAISDRTGSVQERYDYSAYGAPTVLTPAFAAHSESAYNWETFFAGYYYCTETALYNVRRRIYHPILGNWIQRDPLGTVVETNLYQYVAGNPQNKVDPAGLTWKIELFYLCTAGWSIAFGDCSCNGPGSPPYGLERTLSGYMKRCCNESAEAGEECVIPLARQAAQVTVMNRCIRAAMHTWLGVTRVNCSCT
jgi:RHS repeat-associated protein